MDGSGNTGDLAAAAKAVAEEVHLFWPGAPAIAPPATNRDTTNAAGDITVDWSKIKSLHTGGKYAVISSSDKLKVGRPAPQVPVGIDFFRDEGSPANELQVMLYQLGEPISLSRRVPVLENLGFSVIAERVPDATTRLNRRRMRRTGRRPRHRLLPEAWTRAEARASSLARVRRSAPIEPTRRWRR